MAGADEAVIDQDGVAGQQRVDREILQDRLGHVGHGTQVAGAEIALRDHDGVAVEDGRREVLAFPHALREGRVPQGDAELLGNRNQRVPDHGERDGIELGFHWQLSLLIAMMM